MNNQKPLLIPLCGRFLLVHLITITVISALFIFLQNILPEANRLALETFRPFRLGFTPLMAEIVRGIILALLVYPFYNLLVKNSRGPLVLFGGLWGLALLGSLEPFPGSIEGMIYTMTTLPEHLLVMTAGALQVLLYIKIFLGWEKGRRIA